MTLRLLQGDCRDQMAEMEACSVDAIVTDPPYGLTQNKKGGSGAASVDLTTPYGRTRITVGEGPGGFMGMGWDRGVPGADYWCEALRVLKPGGHLLAFGGTRTYHRLAVAIEDAGFEIRDCLMWLYGSGFPKSLDVSNAIDKSAGAEREVIGSKITGNAKQRSNASGEFGSWANVNTSGQMVVDVTAPATDAAKEWEGWGTALKPAYEPIIMARKPLTGTVAATVQAHGTGALNIDGCRIGTAESLARPFGSGGIGAQQLNAIPRGTITGADATGRWPANLMLDETAAALLDAQSGESRSNPRPPSAIAPTGNGLTHGAMQPIATARGHSDIGGASRFFYTAKASRKERGEGNTHPTVKPISLMRWLCRLVTPPGGTILDPFMGSGTTLIAADREGFHAIGIELQPEYLEIAARRIASDAPLLQEIPA